MKKIICIGECALDIVFGGTQPVGAVTGGRIANAAAIMAREGLPVVMASEAARDPAGDMIVGFLEKAGVDVSSVDRFTEGHTPLWLYTDGPEGIPAMTVTRYEDYGDTGFDIIWPRVDDDTIVLFGGFYSLAERTRCRMVPFLNHCAERGALMVYLPGFLSQRVSRITKVMPAILENLETAHMVIARNRDLELIFGIKPVESCYAEHVDFYCRSMVNIDPECRTINYFSGKEVTHAAIPESISLSLHWNAGVTAGVVSELFARDIRPDQLDTPDTALREAILEAAIRTAGKAAASLTADWQRKL